MEHIHAVFRKVQDGGGDEDGFVQNDSLLVSLNDHKLVMDDLMLLREHV